MAEEIGTTRQKALKINLDGLKFGTFAEIGAGQEVVRWFFHAGKSANTVAMTVSAYDMAISDGIYGPTEHYVSRQRLEAMLDHEFQRLIKDLDQKRGDRTAFFVFADTAATQTHSARPAGHTWAGVRFQTQPRGEPSEIIIHAEMLDPVAVQQQDALGMLGVNLIHGAFYHADDPPALIGSLMEDLSRRRIEVDMIHFCGPAFTKVDNRLMSLQLIEQGLTDAAMFTAAGEAVQPAEVLYNKPVMIARGSFRPVTNVTLAMMERAEQMFPGSVAIMEMTLNNLMCDEKIDHQEFLARVDMLGALGRMVMISNYANSYKVTGYLRHYTHDWIGMPIGVPNLRELLDEKHYADLEGGILEGIGKLLQGRVRLFVYPTKDPNTEELSTADNLQVNGELQHLYHYLRDRGSIEPVRDVDQSQLDITPADVLAAIGSGDPGWAKLVPPQAAAVIKKEHLFGYREPAGT